MGYKLKAAPESSKFTNPEDFYQDIMRRIDAAQQEKDLEVPATTRRVGAALRKKIKADMQGKLKSSQKVKQKRKQQTEEFRDPHSISLSSAQTPQPKKSKTRRDQDEFDEF